MTRKNKTQDTAVYRDRIKLGQQLSAQLVPLMTLEECADKLGISYQAVRKAECLALAKVAIRLREATTPTN